MRPDRNMNSAVLTAESSPHATPRGSMAPAPSENSPLASSVPPRMMAAAASSAVLGRRRVTTIWMTTPIQVNWNNSVMATATDSLVSAKLYSTQVVQVVRPSPSRRSTPRGERCTGRLPASASTASATANRSVPNSGWLAATCVHWKPSASANFTVVAMMP